MSRSPPLPGYSNEAPAFLPRKIGQPSGNSLPQRPTFDIAPVRRQCLWDQIVDISNGGFLAHRNPKASEDEPEI